MMITNDTPLLNLVELGLIDDSIYSNLSSEGFELVKNVLMRTQDSYYFDSLKPNIKNFVSFLKDLIEFYKDYEEGHITNDNETTLPSSLIFIFRSIYQKERKRFNAEYVLSMFLSDDSELFISTFIYNILVKPNQLLNEAIIRDKLLDDALISGQIDLEKDRYIYVMVSIIKNFSDALCNFPDGLYYKRLMELSMKEVGIDEIILEKADDFAKIINYRPSSSDVNTHLHPLLDEDLQNEYERLQKKVSIRTRNIIHVNVPTYKDILPWVDNKEKEFGFKQCGKKSSMELRELIDVFSQLYFQYKESPSYKKKKDQADSNTIEVVSFLIQNELDKTKIYSQDIKNNLQNVYNNYSSIARDVINSPEKIYNNLFLYNKKVALDCIDLMIQTCSNICVSINKLIQYKELEPYFSDANNILRNLRSQNIKELEYNKFVSLEKETLLQQEYEKLISRSNVQCQNVIRNNHISFLKLLSYKGKEEELRNFKNVGRKCTDELIGILEAFEVIYYKILNNDSKDARYLSYLNLFPFLKENDLVFLDYYYSYHKHYPMLYILCRYFKDTDNKNAQIIASFYGLNNNPLYDIEKIADKYNNTRERVRQILLYKTISDSVYKKIMEPSLWESYDLQNDGLITIQTSQFKALYKSEKLEISFYSYCSLLMLLIDIFIINVTETPRCLLQTDIADYISRGILFKTYGISSEFKNFRFISAFNELNRLLHLRRNTSIKIPLSDYFVTNPDYWSGNQSLDTIHTEVFLKIFENMIRDLNEEYIDNHYLVLEANKTNYSEIMYEILKDSGKSMHLHDIFKRYKELYPNSKYDEAKQIKPFLFNDDRIKNIGRSSMYTLAEWNDYTGNLFDLAVDLVRATKDPILTDDLVNEMLVFRPTSTERSVRSIIKQCINEGHLVMFYGDIIGLPKRIYKGEYVLQPQTFDEWLIAFKDYALKNNCFPIGYKKGIEGSLYHWYYETKSYVNLSSEEIISFHNLMEELSSIPHNMAEKRFLNNCEAYREFVKQTGRMLMKKDDESLFTWFRTHSLRYVTYDDNRRQYFKELINFLQEHLDLGGM